MPNPLVIENLTAMQRRVQETILQAEGALGSTRALAEAFANQEQSIRRQVGTLEEMHAHLRVLISEAEEAWHNRERDL